MPATPISDTGDRPGAGDEASDAVMEHTLRIGRAWIELRRGANTAALRDFYFGRDNRLEQGQMDALDLLMRGALSMKAFAEQMRIDPSSATRAVDRLAKDGLVERFASPDDGRIVMVRITDEGRRRREPVAQRRALVMSHVIATFEPHEREQLANLFEQLTAAIDATVDDLRCGRLDSTEQPGRDDPATDADVGAEAVDTAVRSTAEGG